MFVLLDSEQLADDAVLVDLDPCKHGVLVVGRELDGALVHVKLDALVGRAAGLECLAAHAKVDEGTSIGVMDPREERSRGQRMNHLPRWGLLLLCT